MEAKQAAKDKRGKPDLTILPYAGLVPAAQAGMFGADKYGRYNYHLGHPNTDLLAAALRHIHKYNEGENLDIESGVHHLGHAIFNLLMILQERELGTLQDVRAKPEKLTPDHTTTYIDGIAKLEFTSSSSKHRVENDL